MDHGAYVILCSLFPNADIPVTQLSLGNNLNPQLHFNLAKELIELRKSGVLILGSGNITHNLRLLSRRGNLSWAQDFDKYIKNALENENILDLINYNNAGEISKLAVPTVEHYLPLLYVYAQKLATDKIYFFNDSIDLGSLSMRSFVIADNYFNEK